LVAGKPFSAYRLRVVPDEPNSLLTVRLLSDPLGKCGAAQVVHAMNVMCGFEESLGIS
jgi:N-acetyl-gamma-glutamylphosphate reductase